MLYSFFGGWITGDHDVGNSLTYSSMQYSVPDGNRTIVREGEKSRGSPLK